MPYTTGGMAVVGTGMALAEKQKEPGSIVASFIGEGALGQGALYEAMNIASLWDLPILYALENNLYAMSTGVGASLAGDTLGRARSLDIASRSIEADDVADIRDAALDACRLVREESRPFVLEMKTYRFLGHSLNDDCSYRTREEEAEWRARDPLAKLASRIDPGSRTEIEERCARRIEKAVDDAHSAPVQDLADIETGLWQS